MKVTTKTLVLSVVIVLVAAVTAMSARAWELEAMNRAINETNFVVNDGCSGTLINLQDRHILTAEHCVSNLTVTIEEDELQPDGTVKKVKRFYRKPLEVRQATYDDKGNITGAVVYRARIIGTNKTTDLALLQLLGETPHGMDTKVLPFDKGITRGEEAFIVGNPFGLEATVTRGIVSHLRRELPGVSGPSNEVKFTQVDGGAAPGNSGGAIYNTEGYLIGVLVRGYNSAGHLSFAVSIEDIREFLANPTGVTEYSGGF